jgi:tetratricopeptide (TPR) repeat protein
LGTGRFELRGTLGSGGAGTVYRAFDRQLGREVALKLLRHASGRDLFRFKREFRSLADITHPGLVQLLELHADAGDWYFTMELVEGVSFIDWVRPPASSGGPKRTRADIAASPLDEPRLRRALVQLVDALIALHRAGQLHRDLKPSNVLVTRRGRLALLDFGLVSSVAERDPDKLAVGTPAYMSPEQAADQPLTEASDWYGLGAMIYEALVGRRPFEGEAAQIMTRKQREMPASPAGAPADLARLALRMLATSPAARPTGVQILHELGAAPSPRTRAITPSVQPPVFVGRERELAELGRAAADTRMRGVTVLVRGKSGLGKSTVMRRFLRELGERAVVLEGRCFEREQVPFKMLDGVVDVLAGVLVPLPPETLVQLAPRETGALVRLFPVLRRVNKLAELAAQSTPPADPSELRRRGFAALRHVLARLARIRPLAIFIDDAHWGDADSAAFVADLIHPGEPNILVAIAHRPEDYLGVIAKLGPGGGRRGDVREIELHPLDDADARALVAPFADPVRAEAIVRAGAGNPLVLSELARADAVSGTIDAIVRSRAEVLRPDAQAMLAVSAIAARPLPIDVAARAAGVVGGHGEAAELAAARLATVRHAGGEMILQPAHDHVRQAVLGVLDVEAKAYWHEALARAFEDLHGDAQAVVEHWLAAGHPANAAQHALVAAQRAEDALAFRRAAELYDIALAYGPWDASGQRDLLRHKADALAAAGQLDAAAEIYAHAAELLPGNDAEAIDLQRLHIEALLRRGRTGDAIPAAAQLLAQIGIRSSLGKSRRPKLSAPWFSTKLRTLDFVERPASACAPEQLLRVDVLYSIVSGLAFADPSLGRALQPELLRAALECGEPMRVCLALAQEVCYAASAGSRNSGVVDAVGARLDELAHRLDRVHVHGLADTALGIAAVMNGRFAQARDRLEAGLAALRDHAAGMRWEIDVGELYWLVALFHVGDWRELMRQSQLVLRDALERGDVAAQLTIRTGHANLAWLIAGKPDEAHAQLAAATAALPDGFTLGNALAVIASCNLAVYTGDAAHASRQLAVAWTQLDRIGLLRQQHMRVELIHLRARVSLSDRTRPDEECAALAFADADELAREAVPWAVGLEQLVRASAHAFLGDADAAIDALRVAEHALAGSTMHGWLHVARMRRGLAEGGQSAFARAAAARDALLDAGVADPEQFAALLVPWPT